MNPFLEIRFLFPIGVIMFLFVQLYLLFSGQFRNLFDHLGIKWIKCGGANFSVGVSASPAF